jgi:hypothetical protein
MRIGRERYYSRYDLIVADPLRESHFERTPWEGDTGESSDPRR